jgi:hypothetical protein
MAEQDPELREAFANLIIRSLMSKGDGFVCAFATLNSVLSWEEVGDRISAAGKDYSYSFSTYFEGITTMNMRTA